MHRRATIPEAGPRCWARSSSVAVRSHACDAHDELAQHRVADEPGDVDPEAAA